MRDTRNAVALLNIQGWTGVGVLLTSNFVSQYRTRFTAAPTGPSWQGRCGVSEAIHVSWKVWMAGVFHSLNAVLTNWSVLVGGVALTQALKAPEPVVAALLTQWILGSTISPGRVASIAVIVIGLGVLMVPIRLPRWAGGMVQTVTANVIEEDQKPVLDVSVLWVVTAVACVAVALRNICLKLPVPSPPPPPLGLLVCSVVGTGISSAGLLVSRLWHNRKIATVPLLRVSGLNAALCFVGYNLASFNLLSQLSPVGHAVGNSSKLVLLFETGLFLLKENDCMSARQLIGASVAFVGLASYNLAKGAPAQSPQKVQLEMVDVGRFDAP